MAARTNQPLQASLRDSGVRLTRQRRILVDVLENTPGHFSARDLLRIARHTDPTIDRATVYRTLALLKSNGLVDELDLLHLEGEEHFYERRRTGDHAHLGCPSCGKIQELETELVPALVEEVRQRTGFAATAVRIEVRGVCPECQTSRS